MHGSSYLVSHQSSSTSTRLSSRRLKISLSSSLSKIILWREGVKELFVDSSLRGNSSPEDNGFFASLSLDGKCVFLQYLYDHLSELNEEIIAKIDGEYSLTSSKNMEILWRWFRITIPVGYPVASDYIHTFVGSIGRMKMIQPIYAALVANGEQEIALAYFNEFKSFYHPIAVSVIQKIISSGEKEGEEEFMKRSTIQY